MVSLSKYSPDSQKSFGVFLFFVIIFLLGVVAYMGMEARELEEKNISPQEAQSILDTLPNNPDASGLTPKDKSDLLQGLEGGE